MPPHAPLPHGCAAPHNIPPPSLRQKLELHGRERKRLSKNALKVLEEACELRCDMVCTGCDPRSLLLRHEMVNNCPIIRRNISHIPYMSHIPQIPKAVTIDTSKVSGKIDLPRVVQKLKKRGFHALRQGTNHYFTMMKIVWYPRPHFTPTATGQYVVVLGSALGKDPACPKEENEPPVEPGTAFGPAVQAPPSVSLWTVLAKMGGACTGKLRYGCLLEYGCVGGDIKISPNYHFRCPPPAYKYKGGTRMEVPWSLRITAVTFWAWTAGQRTGPS